MKSNIGDVIDDMIETWHMSNTTIPIHEYLYMTEEEYAMFVMCSHTPSNMIERILRKECIL